MSDIVDRLKAAENAMRWEGIADAIAEIERLREAVKFLNGFRPDAELARLRGLLREGLDHHDEYDWQQRVREAIGE